MSKKKRGEERMKEEDNILEKVGKKNSFKVPEGYFENLTSEVMGKLPEKEGPAFEEVKQPTMWIRMKPLLYIYRGCIDHPCSFFEPPADNCR